MCLELGGLTAGSFLGSPSFGALPKRVSGDLSSDSRRHEGHVPKAQRMALCTCLIILSQTLHGTAIYAYIGVV